MPFKTELNAITKLYVKLMKLPMEDMLPALTKASIISDRQREKMIAMKLDKDRASYLLDDIIIASLKCDNRDTFNSFLQVLEEDENPLTKKLCEDLKSYLGPSPPQSSSMQPPQGQPQQLPYDQTHPYGQWSQRQLSCPIQSPLPYGQPPQGQFSYEQPPQGQFSYGQSPQGQFSYHRQSSYPPQGQFSPSQGQSLYGQSPQGEFSPFQRQFSCPPQGQFSYEQTQSFYGQPPQGQSFYGQPPQGQSFYGQPPQGGFSYGQPPQGQSFYGQPPQGGFSYGQSLPAQPQQHSYSEPLQGQLHSTTPDNQSYYPQDQSQSQSQPCGDAFSQQNHQPLANITIPSENPLLQGTSTNGLPLQNQSEGTMHQQKYPQQTENARSEYDVNDPEITEVQQDFTDYPPQEEISKIPTNQTNQLPEEEIAEVESSHANYPQAEEIINGTNDELQKEIPKVLQSHPSEEEIINVHQDPTNDQLQSKIPKVLQSRPSLEEIVSVDQNSTNDQPQNEIPKVLQSRPSQEEIINVHQNSTNDQPQNEIPKVLQSRPSQEDIIGVDQNSTNGQPQNEIPKVLQCRPSLEEIISVDQNSTNDQPQNKIPKVLQSRPSQEEIIGVDQNSTNDQPQNEIPKVLQSRPSLEEIISVDQNSTNDQPQNEIPKILQSRPSLEEIINVHQNSTNDQPQNKIPRVLQSRPSQEEIIKVYQNPTNDQLQSKVLQSPVNYPSQEEITDVQPPCDDNEMQQSSLVDDQPQRNSSINSPQQTLETGKNTTEPVQEKKMRQRKAIDSLQAMGWIECMKSVCRIESKCKGTGVIGYLTIEGSLQYVLLTCNHVIPTEDDAKSARFYFGYTDNIKDSSPFNASNILDTSGQWFWYDPTYRDPVKKKYGLNYSMMKVKKSELDKIMFPEISRLMDIQGVQMISEDAHIEVEDSLTLMAQIPHLSVTYGNCKGNPSTAVMKYDIASVQGSAGGPVFKQEAGNAPHLVAIHNGYAETKNHGVNIYMNYGVRLLEILNHCTGKHSLPMPPSGFTYKQE